MNENRPYIATLRELRLQRRNNLERIVLLRERIQMRYDSLKEQLSFAKFIIGKIKEHLPDFKWWR